jgi:hypothetical protein
MRKISVLFLAVFVVTCFTTFGFAAPDKDAIKKQVDEIVVAMDGGKKADDFKDAAKKEPNYVFIMQEDGMMLVHPSLVGKGIKDTMAPVYAAVSKATPEGLWVDYEWQGKMKHSYVRKTKGALIVGSGYSD